MENPKLTALNQTFATLKTEFDIIKAEISATPDSEMCSKKEMYGMMDRIMNSVYSMVDNLHQRINAVDNAYWEQLRDHYQGHAPAFKTASQLQAFLKTCGMDKDYNVIKPAIFASTKHGMEVTLDYSQTMKK